MTTSTYLRYPHVHEGLVAFVAEDDVWLAEVPAGGSAARAWRVTSDWLPVAHPRISPDGARIAWQSPKDGAPEIYVAPVDGGDDLRLTYWGDFATDLAGWRSAGEIVAVTTHAPGWANTRAFAVAADGGVPEPLPYGTVRALDVRGPGGAVLLQRGLRRDSSSWKRYRGGTAGKLWLDPDGSGEFHRFLPEHEGNVNYPLWVGGRAAFLSDAEGVSELYSALPDGTDLRRHTSDPAGYYARQAATDGTRVVFARAGRLWLMEDLDAEPRPLEIRLTGTRIGRARHPVGAARNLGGWDTDQTGRASVVTVRGTVHWLTHREGPARVLAAEDGVRARTPVVLGDTGDVAWVTDAGGEDGLEIAAADGTGEHRRILSGELARVDEIVASPDGAHLAVATEDNRLLLVEVETGAVRTVAEGEHRSYSPLATGVVFSPDSAWLAWTEGTAVHEATRIRLADVATLTASDVTEGRFVDWSPAFTVDGKHLAFLSTRTFDPRYDEYVFDLSFVPGTRPYLVPLSAEEPSPFAPHLKGRPVGDEDKEDGDKAALPAAGPAGPAALTETVETAEASEAETADPAEAAEDEDDDKPAKKDSKKKAPASKIDREGLKGRIVPFPVRAGEYAALAAVKGGVLWIEEAVHGRLGESLADARDEPDRSQLRRYDFAKREISTLVDELDGYSVSGDGARIVYRDGGTLRCQPADSRGDNGDKEPLDLDRIRVTVDPVAERRQAYNEAWRLQRDFYWRPDMNGTDWEAVRVKYEPLVGAVATSSDFQDLLNEMHGELATSHAYVSGAGTASDSAKRQGLLGADLGRDAEGAWRIVRILAGDSSVPSARSPLEAPGVAARAGDVIAAVDGVPVPSGLGPGPLLAGKAGRPVELTLRRDGAEARRVVVVPIDDEYQLRYVAWVTGRRAHVAERSAGRLGYIHLPDQGPRGWAEFHRDLSSQTSKEGLVVDTRGNGGGNTSELVLEKLLRSVIGWSVVRGRMPYSYPRQAPLGPIVSVCDEHAASDGDIINQALKDHGVPIVGVRTWGGVVGIDSRFRLVDGTAVTQPKYAHWFDSVGFGVENRGVDPTVEVHLSPQDMAAGRDPQLDEAIRILLEKLETAPAATPPPRPWLEA